MNRKWVNKDAAFFGNLKQNGLSFWLLSVATTSCTLQELSPESVYKCWQWAGLTMRHSAVRYKRSVTSSYVFSCYIYRYRPWQRSFPTALSSMHMYWPDRRMVFWSRSWHQQQTRTGTERNKLVSDLQGVLNWQLQNDALLVYSDRCRRKDCLALLPPA